MITDNLPPLVREALEPIDSTVQREIALPCFLAIAAGFFSKAYFVEKHKKHGFNLNILIIMPPGSGKGIVSTLATIAAPLSEELREKHRFSSGGRHRFLVSADTTAPRLVKDLHDNQGRPMVMIDTELDTWINSGRGEHGRQLSALLRKTYEREPISLSRKKDAEELYIPNPWLATVLTGTESQLDGFMKGSVDGLQSRFFIMRGRGKNKWESQKPDPGAIPLEDFFKTLGNRLRSVFWKMKSNNIEVSFTEGQWQRQDDIAKRWDEEFAIENNPNSNSIIYRGANMMLRLAGILTMLRQEGFPHGSTTVKMECDDRDFETARLLMETSLDNSMELLSDHSHYPLKGNRNPAVKRFYEKLPKSFETKEAVKTAQGLDIPERSAKRYLRQMLEKKAIAQDKPGVYRKATLV